MTSLAHIQGQERHAWTDQLCLPYESAFGRLQKFAWGNVLDGRGVARVLFSKPALPRRRDAWGLFSGSWIKTPPTLPTGLSLDDGWASSYGRWMYHLCRQDILRFCPKCLEEGFHSLLYQIDAMTRCPRHGAPFELHCRSCKATVQLALNKDVFQQPFCCPKCSKPLAGAIDAKRWLPTPEKSAQLLADLRPIADWLKALSNFQVSARGSPLAQLSFAGEYAGELDTVVNYSIARHFVPPPWNSKHWLTSRRPLLIENLVTEAEDILEVTQLEVHKLEKRQFEQLQNKLKSTVLQAHADCWQKARRGVWMRSDFQQAITEQETGLCPIAAGYARWLKRFLVDAEQGRQLALKAISSKMPYLYASSAQKQLAQFYSSIATAYVYELLRRGGHRIEPTVEPPLSDLLERYCFGTRDRDAYWEVLGPRVGDRGNRWIVMGAPSLLELMGRMHLESLASPRPPNKQRPRAKTAA